MVKEMIVLARSDKHGGYCVAGLDRQTGEFIRLVSEDEQSEYALYDNDIIYEDNTIMNVNDIIQVKVKGNQNLWNQPENYIIDQRYYIRKIGEATIDDIRGYVRNPEYIFYNNDKSIETGQLLDEFEKYSFTMVRVPQLKLWKDNYKDNRIIASFEYNGNEYNFIKITDHEINSRYYNRVLAIRPHPLILCNVLLVMSLAGEYQGRHYKLIANIIEE